MRPLVAPFSASYSTNSSGEPTPAVTPGSKATTVAADGGLLKATFQSGGTINNTAINRPIRLDPSEFTLKPRLLKVNNSQDCIESVCKRHLRGEKPPFKLRELPCSP